MKTKLIAGLIILLSITSCKKPAPSIIPTDVDTIFAQAAANGLTVEESDSLSHEMFRVMQQNTEGKQLPAVAVEDLNHRKISLPDQIDTKSIILAIDIHCAFGFECALNEYPRAVKRVNEQNLFGPTVCLVIRTPYDHDKPGKFNAAIGALKPLYEKLFVIEESDARKINLLSGSTRFYVNEDKIIRKVSIGTCSADKIAEEITL